MDWLRHSSSLFLDQGVVLRIGSTLLKIEFMPTFMDWLRYNDPLFLDNPHIHHRQSITACVDSILNNILRLTFIY